MRALTATSEMIRALDLKPHPEGGHYRQTFQEPVHQHKWPRRLDGDLFLVARGELSALASRPNAVEVWHYHAGAPLVLEMADDRRDPPPWNFEAISRRARGRRALPWPRLAGS